MLEHPHPGQAPNRPLGPMSLPKNPPPPSGPLLMTVSPYWCVGPGMATGTPRLPKAERHTENDRYLACSTRPSS
jgi:hypothetical protein